MWIVRVALDRPYTFIVLALLSPVVILRTPTDIFPVINIPVIAVAWQYTGLNLRRRMGATVLLVKVLGGGWTIADLPSLAGTRSPAP